MPGTETGPPETAERRVGPLERLTVQGFDRFVSRYLSAPRVLFAPDRNLGTWIASKLPEVELVLVGQAEALEQFEAKV
mgnify:CR=1 FL=1